MSEQNTPFPRFRYKILENTGFVIFGAMAMQQFLGIFTEWVQFGSAIDFRYLLMSTGLTLGIYVLPVVIVLDVFLFIYITPIHRATFKIYNGEQPGQGELQKAQARIQRLQWVVLIQRSRNHVDISDIIDEPDSAGQCSQPLSVFDV